SVLLVFGTSLHYGSPFLIDKLAIVIAVSAIALLIVSVWIYDGVFTFPRLDPAVYRPAAALFFYILLRTAIPGPANQRYSFEALFAASLILLFFVYLYAGFGERENALSLVKSVVYSNAALMLVYLIKGTALGTQGHVFSGWLVNHNHLAMLAGMLMPFPIAMSVYKHQSRRDRALWLCASLVLLAGFLFSVSRGGYLSFVVAISTTLLAAAWLGVYSRKTALVLFGTAVAAGIFVLNLYTFAHRIFSNLFLLSASQRFGIWWGSIRMFMSHPVFGWGMGTYEDAFYRFRPPDILYLVNHAHDIFIEIADDTGIVGLALFLWLIAGWLICIIKGMRQTSSDFKRAMLWAGLTSSLYLILHNTVDFGIFVPSNAVSAILLMAATASVMQGHGHELPLDYFKRLPARHRALLALAAGVLFLSTAIVCSRAIYGEYYYEKGKASLSGGRAAGQVTKAIGSLSTAERFVETDLVHYESGRAWFLLFVRSGTTSALDNAIREFKRAGVLCPWNPYYPEDTGALYLYRGDIRHAILYTRKALSLDPSNASLCMRAADMEIELGRTSDAIAYYTRACRIYPGYEQEAIHTLIENGVDVDRLVRFADSVPGGEWALANGLISERTVNPTYPPAGGETAGRAMDMGKEGRDAIAAGILERLMASDEAHLNRYVPLFISIVPDKKDALVRLESLHITDACMLFYLASLQSRTGDDTTAIRTLERVIHMDSRYRDAYRLLSDIYASEGRVEEAIAVLKMGLYYLPSDSAFYAMLGAYYGQDNDWYNAIESYRMAVTLDPAYENGYVQMALIYKSQGMHARSLDVLKKGREALPGSAHLLQMLRREGGQ
ncbi:MAG: O-antigen ligase family protein, partial [Deltaproteobacteria bacterium]|nr:O-antigen ligase family protein [Deltaproteobacteria bacterium]